MDEMREFLIAFANREWHRAMGLAMNGRIYTLYINVYTDVSDDWNTYVALCLRSFGEDSKSQTLALWDDDLFIVQHYDVDDVGKRVIEKYVLPLVPMIQDNEDTYEVIVRA
jgi:hypothetical protein